VDEPSLEGVRAKLGRADEHLRSLDAEVPSFLADKPHEFRGHIDRKASRYFVTVHIKQEPPIAWSVIVGEFVHNLRSALDHLVWQLIVAAGREPIGGSGGNQFPIFTVKPGDLRKRKCLFNKQLRGLPRYGRAIINQMQPYHARRDARLRPLAVLADLSNEDKHQAILPAFASIPQEPLEDGPGFDLVAVTDVAEFDRMEIYVNRPLEDGAETMSADIEITGPNPHVKMKGNLPFDIAFGQRMIPLEQLTIVRNAVNEIVSGFEPVFN
jgi:hypothetical protein